MRPDWINSAGLAGASRFDELVTAATTNRFVRDLEPDAVTNLGSLGGTEFREAVGILDDLGVVDQELVDAVLLQSDFLGGVRQLVPGAEPRLVTINGVPHALDVTGRPIEIRRPVRDPDPTELDDGSTVYRLETSDGVGFDLRYDPEGFVVFPEEIDGVLARSADVSLGPEGVAAGTVGDFAAANSEVRRILNDPRDASLDGMPAELRSWFLSPSSNFNGPPKGISIDSSTFDFTWHHHQETGRLQLVNTSFHESASGARHTGGSSLWGNSLVRRLLGR